LEEPVSVDKRIGNYTSPLVSPSSPKCDPVTCMLMALSSVTH